MKKSFHVLALLCAVAVLSGIAAFASGGETAPVSGSGTGSDGAADATLISGAALKAILERGVLRVGSTGDYNPMSYLDPETNRYVGFDAGR